MPPDHLPSLKPPFDPAWLDEARIRSAEVEAGAIRPDPWIVVRERVRRRLEDRGRASSDRPSAPPSPTRGEG